jgi:nitrate/TMAO reductase-like tetraheme cytochrome c subunit
MARIRSWYSENRLLAIVWLIALVIVMFAAIIAAAYATDHSDFCDSCHEMTPYHDAWSQGAHAAVPCVACHVDAGAVERLGHKFTAMGEVWVHVTGEPRFPLAENALIPDDRCLSCHEDVAEEPHTGFSHSRHAEKGNCIDCHSDTGHEVTDAALSAAGILAPDVRAAKDARRVAAVGEGSANLAGHIEIACSSCHDMAATPCTGCHEPGHDPRGDTCTQCHATGVEWTFTHPEETACQDCHETPDEHVVTGEVCATCHINPGVDFGFAHPVADAQGVLPDCEKCHARPNGHSGGTCIDCHAIAESWAFRHPASTACQDCHARPASHPGGPCVTCHTTSASWDFSHASTSSTCTTCHARPAGHSQQTCTRCHTVGSSWAFRHPASSANCASCHTRPVGHPAAACTTCHTTAGWSFRHPGSSSTCTTCHARPAGHSQQTCTGCHTVGSSWAFRHPASTACASCHSTPSRHYGSSCASCHTPSRAWSSATFDHPPVSTDEHTYRSFSCVSCHPSGYSSYSCTGCHGADGPEDDDD